MSTVSSQNIPGNIDDIVDDIGLDQDVTITPPTVEDISKPVDEDGNVTENMKLAKKHKLMLERSMHDNQQQENVNDLQYCPVCINTKEDGGLIFSAYVVDQIIDVDNYIDLIDTLLTASEKDTYYIYIDSPGGMISSGGIIASAIHHSRAEVFTIARGLCASAAALIHSAAKKDHQLTSDYAVMMYHMSSHCDAGTSTKILERAKHQVRYVNECLLNKALEDGNFTQDEFSRIQNGEEIFVSAAEFKKRIGEINE